MSEDNEDLIEEIEDNIKQDIRCLIDDLLLEPSDTVDYYLKDRVALAKALNQIDELVLTLEDIKDNVEVDTSKLV